MPKQHQGKENYQEPRGQLKNRPSATIDLGEDQINLIGLIEGHGIRPYLAPNQAQAHHINDSRFQIVQRQSMAVYIGHMVGNQYLQKVLARPKYMEPNANSETLHRPKGMETPSLQLVPGDQNQSLARDTLGWVGDLVSALGWAIFAGGEQRGRASLHLMHNMFGSGQPITVPKEWVMDSPQWREAYRNLLSRWVEHVVSDAATRDLAGESEGSEHYSETVSAYSLPMCTFPTPMCPGADQFYGSGGARLTVGGDYSWRLTRDMLPVLQIDIYNVVGSYNDRYVWNHTDDPGQYSRQQRGWSTPFDLRATWREADRVERRLRAVGLPPGSLHAGPP